MRNKFAASILVGLALLFIVAAPSEVDAQGGQGVCAEEYGACCDTLVDICSCYDHLTGTYWCDYIDCWDADDSYCSLAICHDLCA